MTFMIPISVTDKKLPSTSKVYMFMSGISCDMTIKQVRELFIEMCLENSGTDYSGRNINILIKGNKASDEQTCRQLDIDSSTCLNMIIL